MIETLVETIIWIAEKRIKEGQVYQNRTSAVHAIIMEISLAIDFYMADLKNQEDLRR